MFQIIAEEILTANLDFHTDTSTYSSHALHAFAAKFPPQIPRIFIEMFSKEGQVVLDPMNGSGTTTLEAYLLNRVGLGFDIDPLAVKIARVKTTPLDIDVPELLDRVLGNAERLLADRNVIAHALSSRFDKKTKEFVDYWFLPETQKELMALVLAIEQFTHDDTLRDLLDVLLSSIIVTKSGGVTRARDLAHTRPHLDLYKNPRNVFSAFAQRFSRFAPVISDLPNHRVPPLIKQGHAKKYDLATNSVHLIITSPPYANAIDYMRAHKFSLVWLGYSINELGPLRSQYIGSEAVKHIQLQSMPGFTEEVLCSLRELDGKKEAILRKYFMEMRNVMKEMHRVLKRRHYCVMVVGTSTMRGIDVKTPYCLADIAHHDLGFKVVGIKSRNLDRDRRMLPFSHKSTVSQIEQRMQTEEVIILKKA